MCHTNPGRGLTLIRSKYLVRITLGQLNILFQLCSPDTIHQTFFSDLIPTSLPDP